MLDKIAEADMLLYLYSLPQLLLCTPYKTSPADGGAGLLYMHYGRAK